MNKILIKSPAKLNLYLKIISKLSNNYHELDTRFQLIDLYDDLSFLSTKSRNISVKCSDPSIKEKDNIVYKTAILMQELNNGGGIDIDIKKSYSIRSWSWWRQFRCSLNNYNAK